VLSAANKAIICAERPSAIVGVQNGAQQRIHSYIWAILLICGKSDSSNLKSWTPQERVPNEARQLAIDRRPFRFRGLREPDVAGGVNQPGDCPGS